MALESMLIPTVDYEKGESSRKSIGRSINCSLIRNAEIEHSGAFVYDDSLDLKVFNEQLKK